MERFTVMGWRRTTFHLEMRFQLEAHASRLAIWGPWPLQNEMTLRSEWSVVTASGVWRRFSVARNLPL